MEVVAQQVLILLLFAMVCMAINLKAGVVWLKVPYPLDDQCLPGRGCLAGSEVDIPVMAKPEDVALDVTKRHDAIEWIFHFAGTLGEHALVSGDVVLAVKTVELTQGALETLGVVEEEIDLAMMTCVDTICKANGG